MDRIELPRIGIFSEDDTPCPGTISFELLSREKYIEDGCGELIPDEREGEVNWAPYSLGESLGLENGSEEPAWVYVGLGPDVIYIPQHPGRGARLAIYDGDGDCEPIADVAFADFAALFRAYASNGVEGVYAEVVMEWEADWGAGSGHATCCVNEVDVKAHPNDGMPLESALQRAGYRYDRDAGCWVREASAGSEPAAPPPEVEGSEPPEEADSGPSAPIDPEVTAEAPEPQSPPDEDPSEATTSDESTEVPPEDVSDGDEDTEAPPVDEEIAEAPPAPPTAPPTPPVTETSHGPESAGGGKGIAVVAALVVLGIGVVFALQGGDEAEDLAPSQVELEAAAAALELQAEQQRAQAAQRTLELQIELENAKRATAEGEAERRREERQALAAQQAALRAQEESAARQIAESERQRKALDRVLVEQEPEFQEPRREAIQPGGTPSSVVAPKPAGKPPRFCNRRVIGGRSVEMQILCDTPSLWAHYGRHEVLYNGAVKTVRALHGGAYDRAWEALMKDHGEWVEDRRTCGADVGCVTQAFVRRISVLESWSP